MTKEKALTIANNFLKKMNPDMWDGNGSVHTGQIHINTKTYEYKNIFPNVSLCINLENPEYNPNETEWFTHMELIDDPDGTVHNIIDARNINTINSPDEIAEKIINMCDVYIKEFIGQIIDVFEDFLTEKRAIPLNNEPIIRTDDFVYIHDSDYDLLSDKIHKTITKWNFGI